MALWTVPGVIGRERARARRGEEGFTLLEVLVAIALFGVVLTAATGVFISSARSVGDQRLRAAATRLASDRLETLRSVAFDQLENQAGLTSQTIYGRQFSIDTMVVTMVAATGDAPSTEPAKKELKKITAVVAWTAPGGVSRNVSYTTAVAADPRAPAVQKAIGTITMFPSPTTTDASGRPLADIDVTVPMGGFTANDLVNLSWTNKDGTAGAKTLTTTSGLNWRGTIAKTQVLAALGANGLGQVQFTASAGTLSAKYDLAVQKEVAAPPVVTGATIDRNPVNVAKVASGKICAAAGQCQNTTDLVFTLTTTGLDPAQDSVRVQFQLYDSTFQEAALTPVSGVSGEWKLTVKLKTVKFRAGTARAFNFTAVRSSDGATASFTVSRDVVSV